MKKLFIKYTVLVIILFWSCTEQAPTELFYDDSQELDIEILAPDPDLLISTNGYDSTGIVEPIPRFSNIITVSGIKNTHNNNTQEDYYAAALFFDKQQPVETSDNRLLGYRLRTIGKVSFDDNEAMLRNRFIRYMYEGEFRDTIIGKFHELRSRRGPGQQRNFPYNSFVKFSLDPVVGENITFNIPTPKEITGEVKVLGSRADMNISLEVKWNSYSDGKIDIIVGGIQSGREILPFFRIRVRDEGRVIIPRELLRRIPFDRFNTIVISLERIKEFRFANSEFSDNLITGKSIHNIKFNVP